MIVGVAVAALLLCGVSLAAPAAGGEMPLNAGAGSVLAHLHEEQGVGAAELAAVPAESRALFAKVLGRLDGMRGELEELKAGKARSDERAESLSLWVAKLEEKSSKSDYETWAGAGGGGLVADLKWHRPHRRAVRDRRDQRGRSRTAPTVRHAQLRAA